MSRGPILEQRLPFYPQGEKCRKTLRLCHQSKLSSLSSAASAICDERIIPTRLSARNRTIRQLLPLTMQSKLKTNAIHDAAFSRTLNANMTRQSLRNPLLSIQRYPLVCSFRRPSTLSGRLVFYAMCGPTSAASLPTLPG